MSEEQKGKSNVESGSKVSEIICKLGPAIATIIAVVGAALIANSFQSKMSATTLISQRELAESELRASMFKDLIGPITQTGSNKGIDRVHEQLLIELLTLNFDGQFEFKPLLLHLDKSLVSEENAKARDSLRSIARRIISRQVSRLINAGAKGDKTKVESLIFIDIPHCEELKKEYYDCEQEKIKSEESIEHYKTVLKEFKEVTLHYGQLRKENVQESEEEEICLESPDKKNMISIAVKDCNWKEQTCEVLLDVKRKVYQPFTLTWFDFPLTDNTLLADGNRFALVFDNINPANKSVGLKLIWFPKTYFTPQERPLNYADIAEKLGFKPEE